MQYQVTPLLDSTPLAACVLAGVAAATVVVSKLYKRPNLDAIPTVGSTSWLGSWRDGRNFMMNGARVIQEGYDKYKTTPFKVADRYRWIVVLTSREHLEEVQRAPDDALSLLEAGSDIAQSKYIMAVELTENPYHHDIIRSQLTRSITNLFDDMRDEISVAFDEVLDLRGNEWKSIPLLKAMHQIVCRTSNRFFVGLPLCRDPDWINLSIQYTLDVVYGSYTVKTFPTFLAPLVARFMTNVPGSTERAMKHLAPIIEERMKLLKKHGKNWTDKPNDALSWLLDVAPEGPERSLRFLTIRVLSITVSSLLSSSTSFFHALFFLAENPQYIQPLREEVESIVEKEGWSKASLGKMYKIDSFLKECQRLAGVNSVSLMRKTLKDFTFRDGTVIPKGTDMIAPTRCLHFDDEHYPNAHAFDPFRFSNMRGEDGEGTKHQFVSTSLDFLPFGHGKHACPGRFFAVNELKAMLAHVVVSYDVKLQENTTRPQPRLVGIGVAPDPFAKLMLRKRVH